LPLRLLRLLRLLLQQHLLLVHPLLRLELLLVRLLLCLQQRSLIDASSGCDCTALSRRFDLAGAIPRATGNLQDPAGDSESRTPSGVADPLGRCAERSTSGAQRPSCDDGAGVRACISEANGGARASPLQT
jgi:hypothetical protein